MARRVGEVLRVSTWPARMIVSAGIVALVWTGVDHATRRGAAERSWVFDASVLGLLSTTTIALAAAVGVVALASYLLWRVIPARREVLRRWVPASLAAAVAMVSAHDTAVSMFARRAQREPGPISDYGPLVVMAAIGFGAALTALALRAALAGAAAGRRRAPLAWAAAGCTAGALLAAADLRLWVALYAKIHTALEVMASVLWLLSALVVLTALVPRSTWGRRIELGLGACLLAWTLRMTWSESARAESLEAVRSGTRGTTYAARAVDRVAYAEALARGGLSEQSVAEAQVDALLDRYDIARVDLDPRWDAPFEEPSSVGEPVRALREGMRDMNVVVFYVDTLRADVAHDEDKMPNVRAFAERSLWFERAYSAGADTVSALPCMVSGRYEYHPVPRRTVMQIAEEYGLQNTLFIPESAHEFLAKLLPSFRFGETIRLTDYRKAGVWGYGADEPTAGPMVEQALSWMADHRDERFFLWLFHFDVHSWHHIDPTYVRSVAERFDVEDTGERRFEYDVAARGVDDAFGRMMDGLEQLGLDDRTVVLLVADHGESLGYYGFWVHSVFLWESIMHVPMVLHVPGVEPRRVSDEVSIIDVAPTLARFIAPELVLTDVHGEDLLSYAAPDRPPRRLPIVMKSMQGDELRRVGMVQDGWKIVQKADWSDPELYDLAEAWPDETDASRQHPMRTLDMLSELVRSPMFVGAYEEVLAGRAAGPE